LRMISLKLGDISEFPFIDRPDLKSIKDGFDLLFELGAIKNRLKAQGSRDKAASGEEDKGQRAEDRHQKSEGRSQTAEVGGHRVVERSQVSGVRCQDSEN